MIDTKLVLRLIETARAVTPLADIRAVALDPEHPPHAEAPLRAQVAARLPDGTFRVLIDGKALKLSLPAEVKPGDVLQLRLLPKGSEPATSRSAPAPPRGALSSAGQVLARVLAQAESAPPRQAEPILQAPPAPADELAQPLARAVERSGVFYESHQARWIEGEFPLSRLLEEPQAALGRRAAPSAPNEPVPPDAAATGKAPLPAARPAEALAPLAAPVRTETPAPESATPASAGTASGSPAADSGRVEAAPERIPGEALTLVRQQLDTLETRQLVWLGDIWPGQTLRWEIGEEPRAERDGLDARAWQSHFELSLPGLGGIEAELVLTGKRLGIRLNAQQAATVETLRAACAELAHALASAGLQLGTCQVNCDERAV